MYVQHNRVESKRTKGSELCNFYVYTLK
jgi:hypothetical protein